MRNLPGERWGFWCVLGLVVGSLAPASPPNRPSASSQGDAKADTVAIRERVQAKIKAASDILDICREFLLAPPGAGGGSVEIAEQIQFWSRQLTDAQLEGTSKHAERVAILNEALNRAKEFEAQIKDLLGNEVKGMDKVTIAKAAYYRADLEVRWLREKGMPADQPNNE